MSEVHIIHSFWMLGSVATSSLQTVRTGFVIHPEKGWLGVWMDTWVSNPSANTASVANTWVNGPYMLPVRTDFCYCLMTTLSSGMRLLKKQCSDNHIKKVNHTIPYVSFFQYMHIKYYGKWLHTWLFYVIIPTLFLYFLLFCYPYILIGWQKGRWVNPVTFEWGACKQLVQFLSGLSAADRSCQYSCQVVQPLSLWEKIYAKLASPLDVWTLQL